MVLTVMVIMHVQIVQQIVFFVQELMLVLLVMLAFILLMELADLLVLVATILMLIISVFSACILVLSAQEGLIALLVILIGLSLELHVVGSVLRDFIIIPHMLIVLCVP